MITAHAKNGKYQRILIKEGGIKMANFDYIIYEPLYRSSLSVDEIKFVIQNRFLVFIQGRRDNQCQRHRMEHGDRRYGRNERIRHVLFLCAFVSL